MEVMLVMTSQSLGTWLLQLRAELGSFGGSATTVVGWLPYSVGVTPHHPRDQARPLTGAEACLR